MLTHAILAIRTLPLGEAEVDQHAPAIAEVIQKVGRLDITVDDAVRMYVRQGTEQAAEIQLRVRDCERAKVLAKVNVFEVRQDGNNLVLVAERGD